MSAPWPTSGKLVGRLRQAVSRRLSAWSARRHGRDTLPLTVHRRRIYIIPTRFGLALSLLLIAMLLAGLNYNSNLGLAFGFLMTSLTFVAMHHCHRNLLGVGVDVVCEVDAFAGEDATFEFALHNAARVERCDIDIRCEAAAGGAAAAAALAVNIAPRAYQRAALRVAAARRGVHRGERFELRTRYPFGWFRAWTYVQVPLIVFAAPRPAGAGRLPPAVAAANGSGSRAETRGDEEFAGLRAYEAGMPLKHMAWKVLARGGEAAVRSYTGLAAQPEWLDFAALDHPDVEARLSQLCRWVVDSEAARRPYGLRLPGTAIPPALGEAHRTACLRALARYPADGAVRP